ncbi:threonine ammonia-lyase [Neogemmobacter tilapiae]|uniref:Serine/threonine dehydratase n=1 Tax=Neogemmobacter tilapiae TaxID=875041 RepID=A0A918WJM9_9RHOB|nr:threonine/serine dehydratase [Gemmobacter tilapiae]GHC48973.1 serine/threonine dehydratase [Gemmobacter tilapiae]
MTDIATIEAAAFRLAGHARRTPLLSSPVLDALAGRQVLIKAECLQHTGSFKFRGGWSAVSGIDAEARERGVIAFSSGNHAQGMAAAAKAHGCPCVILMPSDAPPVKIARTRALGAEVILYDRVKDDRQAMGDALAAERGLTLVPPFDHPLVIAGQASIGLELAEQAAHLGLLRADVLLPCSGGGLAAGVALAAESRAPGLRVRPVEPEGFDDMARSLASGAPCRNARLTGSVCDAILSPEPGKLTLPVLQRLAGPGLSVTDDQALEAMALAFRHLRIVVEPGGAVALAAALFRAEEIEGDTVIAIASGGNVDEDLFIATLQRFA